MNEENFVNYKSGEDELVTDPEQQRKIQQADLKDQLTTYILKFEELLGEENDALTDENMQEASQLLETMLAVSEQTDPYFTDEWGLDTESLLQRFNIALEKKVRRESEQN